MRPPRTRRQECGAAYVEALAVISVLIIVFAGSVYMNDLYEAKLQSSADARALAWSYAYNGCISQPELENSPTAPYQEESPAPPTGLDSATQSPSLDSSPQYQALFSGGHGVISYSGQVSLGGFAPLGMAATTFTGTVSVMCNEIPNWGDPKSFLQMAKDFVRW